MVRTRNVEIRNALIDAGLDLFSKQPVDAVPVDDIVQKAGVSKGSFFNHFTDKDRFHEEIATLIRLDAENMVSAMNDGVTDPLQRLVGGMRVAVEFALREPEKAIIISTQFKTTTARNHPLNSGLNADILACVEQGLISEDIVHSALLFWAGQCSALMLNITDRQLSLNQSSDRMRDIMFMSLRGMGVEETVAQSVTQASCVALINSFTPKQSHKNP